MNTPGGLLHVGDAGIAALPRVERWLGRRNDKHAFNLGLRDSPGEFWRTRLKRMLVSIEYDAVIARELSRLLDTWPEAWPRRDDLERARQQARRTKDALAECAAGARLALKAVPAL